MSLVITVVVFVSYFIIIVISLEHCRVVRWFVYVQVPVLYALLFLEERSIVVTH